MSDYKWLDYDMLRELIDQSSTPQEFIKRLRDLDRQLPRLPRDVTNRVVTRLREVMPAEQRKLEVIIADLLLVQAALKAAIDSAIEQTLGTFEREIEQEENRLAQLGASIVAEMSAENDRLNAEKTNAKAQP